MENKEIDYAFFRKTMGFMRLNTVILKKDLSNIALSDQGLKEKVLKEGSYSNLEKIARKLMGHPDTFTQYTDELGISVILINAGGTRVSAMDESDTSIVLVGPFVEDDAFGVTLKNHFEELQYPESVYPMLKHYVEMIPYYPPYMLEPIINKMLEDGTGRSFMFSSIGDVENVSLRIYSKAETFEVEDDGYNLIVERYDAENRMLSCVKQGDVEEAMASYKSFLTLGVKQKRMDNYLQNSKNYLIVFNTILRKAVEEAGVHPVYIDYYSSAFAVAINNALTNTAVINMGYSMIEKYTRLVKEKSMGHLSPVIKDIVLYIDFHQKEDLSLSFFSDYFNVSKNYLSNLFHKEMGMPLTEYVRDFRMKRAARLLLSSSMTLSDIACAVGYDNPNYFIRHFKQVYHITPRQYQKERGAIEK